MAKSESDGLDRDAFSIPEFCRRHGLSRGHYYNLRNLGQAPREMRLGSRVLIAVEEAKRWREHMTEPAA